MKHRTLMVSAATVGILVTSAQAWADTTSTDALYGQHVSSCTQTMGFDGQQNPGMHEGITGWDPTHQC